MAITSKGALKRIHVCCFSLVLMMKCTGLGIIYSVRTESRQAWAYGDSSVKGGSGGDLPEILHIIFFLFALPRFPPLFCPNLGGQLPPPCSPASYAYM